MTAPAQPAAPRRLDGIARDAFIHLYLASDRFSTEIEKVCREEKIAMSHYTVMWFLARRGETDGVPMGAVIDGHLNRASDATRLADRLCELGFLERLASPGDRRVVLVRLTEPGRAAFARLTTRIRALHRAQWKHLDEGELTTLNALLVKALRGPDAKADEKHPLIAGTKAP